MVSAAGDRVSVLVLARDVPYGATITERDLQVVDVSVDPALDALPASRLNDVVGQVAAVGLTEGALLPERALTTQAPPGDGQLLVGIAVPSGRMPASPLAAGDSVLVVETPPNASDPVVGPPNALRATVVAVAEPDLNGMTVVDVTVSSGDGPALAALAATGRVAVVLQPRGGVE
jgi:hypothetical protein